VALVNREQYKFLDDSEVIIEQYKLLDDSDVITIQAS